MSHIKLIGFGNKVSGEKICIEMNSQGLACTGMSKSMEGDCEVITLKFDDGDGASYRHAQTRADLFIKVSEALGRAGVYIVGSSQGANNQSRFMKIVSLAPELQDLQMDASLSEPPSSPPYGSLEWAKQILPDKV